MPNFTPIRLIRVETTEISHNFLHESSFTPTPHQLTEDLEPGIYIYEVMFRSSDGLPMRSLAFVLGCEIDRQLNHPSHDDIQGYRWPLALRLTIESSPLRDVLSAVSSSAIPVGRVRDVGGSLHRLSQLVGSAEILLILEALKGQRIHQAIPLVSNPLHRDGHILCIVNTEPYLALSTSTKFLLVKHVPESSIKSITSVPASKTLRVSGQEQGTPYLVTNSGASPLALDSLDLDQFRGDPETLLRTYGIYVTSITDTPEETALWLMNNKNAAIFVLSEPTETQNNDGTVIDASLPFQRLFYDFILSKQNMPT